MSVIQFVNNFNKIVNGTTFLKKPYFLQPIYQIIKLLHF